MSDPIPSSPVIDVDQAFPLLTSDGAYRPSAAADGGGTVTPAVEGVLRDVLGWRPRAQDTSAFTAALTASFQLSEVEGHVVATYRPRGFAMQADLGAVSGGQASLYSRAVAAQTQMLTLLDGLTPLRPDADAEDCEAFRRLVRGALTTMIAELGTPGGPRVAVVDAFLRQLLGTSSSNLAKITDITADTVGGQLGALRAQFGLEDTFVNSADQEGVRTAFWTLVDLVTDTKRAWVTLRSQFTGKNQHGFLGTELVRINQLLSAAAQQVDEVEAALDSVFVSDAERQTIQLPGAKGLTLDGLLSWTRTFVTEEGPRIARDTGRDGMVTSFTPTLVDIVAQITRLMDAIGRPTVTWPVADRDSSAPGSPPPASRAASGPATEAPGQNGPRPASPALGPYSIQLPLITLGPGSKLPPGMQAARTRIAVSGLYSLLWQLAKTATRISRYPDVILFDVVLATSQDRTETLVAVRGLNIQQSFVPFFRSAAVPKDVGPEANRTSNDDDTISAVFNTKVLGDWLTEYDRTHTSKEPLKGILNASVRGQVIPASALPIFLRDTVTGKRIRGVQKRP